MKNKKSFFRSRMATTLLFLLAMVLLVSGTIGGVLAAPTIFNDRDFDREFELDQIGVSLVEKNAGGENTYTGTSNKIMGTAMLGSDSKLVVGKVYDEELSVKNSGSIPTWVRVTVYKYWLDEKGNKVADLDPAYIILDDPGSGWVEDTASATNERSVYYYTSLLADGDSTAPFATQVKISSDCLNTVVQTNNNGVITNTRLVDGKTFTVEVEVNAVQDHNAKSAIWSVWGQNPGNVGLSVSDD